MSHQDFDVRLELVDKRQLKLPWRRLRPTDYAETWGCSASYARAGIAITRNVERIERVDTNFQALIFDDPKSFGKRKIVVLEAGTAKRADGGIAKVLRTAVRACPVRC